MSNALFGHLNKKQWASVRMMFARQDAARREPKPTIAYATAADAPEDDRDFIARSIAKRGKRMDRVDKMSPDLRALVHEYGLTIVDSFIVHGVTSPRIIRHLINTVLAGSINGSLTAQANIFKEHRR